MSLVVTWVHRVPELQVRGSLVQQVTSSLISATVWQLNEQKYLSSWTTTCLQLTLTIENILRLIFSGWISVLNLWTDKLQNWMSLCCEIIFCCWICALIKPFFSNCCLLNITAWQWSTKTIASPSHRTIVLIDTIDYRTIGFLHYRPNPSLFLFLCSSHAGCAPDLGAHWHYSNVLQKYY